MKYSKLFFSKKGFSLTWSKLIGLSLMIITALIIISSIGSIKDTTGGGISAVKLNSLIDKCELNSNMCSFKVCNDDLDCDEQEQAEWISLVEYKEKCDAAIEVEEKKKLSCGALYDIIRDEIFSNPNTDLDNSQVPLVFLDYTPLSEEELKDLKKSLGVEFIDKVNEVSEYIDTEPEYLLSVMHFETGGSFDPCIKNGYNGATGLIQFTKSTAENLETSLDSLCKMTRVEQMDYVQKYLNPYKGKVSELHDLYLAVFLPSVIGKKLSYNIDDKYYDGNKGLDLNGDGEISVSEISSKTIKIYEEYYS